MNSFPCLFSGAPLSGAVDAAYNGEDGEGEGDEREARIVRPVHQNQDVEQHLHLQSQKFSGYPDGIQKCRLRRRKE